MVLLVVAVAVAAVGCGGGGSSQASVAPSTTTTTTNRAARTQAFLQCMQTHGVNISSTRGLRGAGGAAPSMTLPPGVTQQQYTAALQACRSLLPTGGGANFQNNPAFQAYRNCLNLQLQQAGVTTLPPSGQGGGGGLGQPGDGGTGTTAAPNPALQAARAHCANLLPAGGFGGPRSSTSTTATT